MSGMRFRRYGLGAKNVVPLRQSDVPADFGLAAKSGGSWQVGETHIGFRVWAAVRGLAASASTAQMTRGLAR